MRMNRQSNFEKLGNQNPTHCLVNTKLAEVWWWFQGKACWRVFGNFTQFVSIHQQHDHMISVKLT